MKESKESVETLFRIRDDEGNILAESDTLIGLLMKLNGLGDEGDEEEECCGRCCECDLDSCCEEDEDDEDEDDVCDEEDEEDEEDDDDEDDADDIDLSAFFGGHFEPHDVEIFRIEITPKKILKAAGIVGGLIALRRLWKRMKG